MRVSALRSKVVLAALSIGLMGLGHTAASAASLTSLDIQAHIDGRDQLIIKDDTLQWHHFDFAAVGRHLGTNSPTLINAISGSTQYEWIPEWPVPPPDEIRSEAFSSVLSGVIDSLPSNGLPWRATKLFGRGSVSIVEQPSAANDFALVVEFDDNAQGGSTFYGVELTAVPVPAAVWLFGSGLLGLIWYSKKESGLSINAVSKRRRLWSPFSCVLYYRLWPTTAC